MKCVRDILKNSLQIIFFTKKHSPRYNHFEKKMQNMTNQNITMQL
jgi:hypothetical protein